MLTQLDSGTARKGAISVTPAQFSVPFGEYTPERFFRSPARTNFAIAVPAEAVEEQLQRGQPATLQAQDSRTSRGQVKIMCHKNRGQMVTLV